MPDNTAPPLGPPRRFERPDPLRNSFAFGSVAIAAIVIGALYFAREVFVPLALAMLLSFALGPLVRLFRRWYLGRVPSVIVAVLFAFVVIFGVGGLIGSQLAHLAQDLPQYQVNIASKIRSIRGTTSGSGLAARASEMLGKLRSEISGPPKPSAAAVPRGPAASQEQKPVPVRILQPDPEPLQIIENVIAPLLNPLTTSVIVVVFVIFFLLQREDIRDRFIRLAGPRDLNRTTQLLDDAGARLSRYLLAQTAVNATFGLLIGIGLSVIGIPNPVLWGVLAMILRFVPYIGPVIAVLFPAALAIAVDSGWMMLVWTLALFFTLEPIMGQIVEPLIYRRSTGLSAMAIVVAAVFWTWLWGPLGLLLSTPLTMCLVVLGKHIERLEFIDVLLGDRPALSPEEGFYQRVLAGDPDEAAHQAEEFLKDKPLVDYYDEVAIKGLALAQLDVNRGALEHERRVSVLEAVEQLIDNLSDHVDLAGPSDHPDAAKPAPANHGHAAPARAANGKTAICVAGRGSLDQAAAAMLAHLLTRDGFSTSIVASDIASASNLVRLDAAGVDLIFLSYLEPGGFTNARYLVRRMRRKSPTAKIILGLWTLSDADALQRNAAKETAADAVITSLKLGIDAARDLVAATRLPLAPALAVGAVPADKLSA